MADNTGPQSNMPDRIAMTESNASQPDANAGKKEDFLPANIEPDTTNSEAGAANDDGPPPATTEADVNASQPSADAAQQKDSPRSIAPTIIGIYGISGVGKTHLCDQLKQQFGEDTFTFFEGSEVLGPRVTGGIEALKDMSDEEQDKLRTDAIESIRDQCASTSKVGIVTGHYSFYTRKQHKSHKSPIDSCKPVMTAADMEIYTHIVYLRTDALSVVRRIQRDVQDKKRSSRPPLSLSETKTWMEFEEAGLQQLCPEHSIVYNSISSSDSDRAKSLIQDFAAQRNTDLAYEALEDGLSHDVKTVLMVDADKTLSEQDASTVFFKQSEDDWSDGSKSLKLKEIIGDPADYSYNTFCQITLYYEELFPEKEAFEKACEKAADAITIRPEFKARLQEASQDKTVDVVVAACGMRSIWEKVLKREGIDAILIGGGRLSDTYVVTPVVKGDLVIRLQKDHGLYVCAVGDSTVDLQMLRNADQSFVVVGRLDERSKTMEAALESSVGHHGLRLHQFLFPPDTIPRLDKDRVPIAQLDSDFIGRIARDHTLKVHQAPTKKAAKLLATNTCDKSVPALQLQEAHKKVGWYLSVEYISEILDVESFKMESVKNSNDEGHRLNGEHKTFIVPLMRGGDPMAKGVHEAFPSAMYHHSFAPADIKMDGIKGKWTIILVDWVINSGESILSTSAISVPI